jgi:hypothetical protein
MKIVIAKNNKEFKVLKNDEIVVKGHRPKWYSSELCFFHNNKTYELKKKGFWGAAFTIFKSGRPIGEIVWSSRVGSKLILKTNGASEKSYWLKVEKTGKWYTSNRQYILCENGETPVLTIDYSLKKWKESLLAEFNDKEQDNYVLLIGALFMVRRKQIANSASTVAVQ